VKRSRRQRKISKVMGEFKDGSLKSGGSGRKVTNPKQAIAIALSEAEGMNQGGIVGLAQMGSPFTNSIRQPSRNQSQRFDQTMGPRSIAHMQQRGFQGPQQMGPMQRNFMQMQNQMQGMQQNPLELYQNYLGQKYIGPMQQEQQNKISQFVGAVNQAERQAFGGQQGGKTFGGRLQPGMPGLGLEQGQPNSHYQGPLPISNLKITPGGPLDTSPAGPQMNQAPDVMPAQGVRDISSANPANWTSGIVGVGAVLQSMNQGGMMYSDIMNRPMFQTPQQRQGMGIMAGVAPVRGYKDGDLADKEDGTEEEGEGLFNEALAKASEMGEDAVNYLLENPVEAALMFIPGLGMGAGLVRFGPKIISGLRRAASKTKAPKKAAGKKQKAPPKSPSAPASSKKAPDTGAPTKKSVTRQVLSGARQGLRPRVAIPGAVAAYAVNQLIESGALDQYINDPRVQQLIEAGTPVYEAVTTFFGDVAEIISPDTGERVELTESAQARLPEVEKARKEGFPEPPTDAKKDDGTGTGVPEATGIMKFLFGKDGIGGDPGAVGKTMDYLADPRTRYALARAAESRPGVVDRNFFTDFTLGQAEYDQLQGKDETALMQNYEFLKAAGKSDDEIFDLLLSKDTESDRRRQLEEDTLTLFNTLKKDDVSNTDRSVLYEEARRMALRNQGLIPPAEPQDSDVTEIALQPAVQ